MMKILWGLVLIFLIMYIVTQNEIVKLFTYSFWGIVGIITLIVYFIKSKK